MKFNDLKYYAIVRNKETDEFSHQKLRGNPTSFEGGITHAFTGDLKKDLSRPPKDHKKPDIEYDQKWFSPYADIVPLPENGFIYQTKAKLVLFDFDHRGVYNTISKKIFNIFNSFSLAPFQTVPMKIVQEKTHEIVTQQDMFFFRFTHRYYLLKRLTSHYDFFMGDDGLERFKFTKELSPNRDLPEGTNNIAFSPEINNLPEVLNVYTISPEYSFWVSENVKKDIEDANLYAVKFHEITPEFYSENQNEYTVDEYPDYFEK